jgi:hypothetical protein
VSARCSYLVAVINGARLARDVVVPGEPDQFTGHEFQRPARAAFGRVRTGRCNQQGLLFAGELAVGSGAGSSLSAASRLPITKRSLVR